jgi:putative FmdB family regulatory protein
MPVYDYLCAGCGRFEVRRPMSESQAPVPCVVCRAPAPRTVSAPRLNLMSSNNRYAETRNEKSAHEPDVVHSLAPGAHHQHHHHHGHSQPDHARPQRKRHAGHDPSRPWMLGH